MGFTEMLLLAAIALIVIGPKQLPDMARVLGRMINEFRRATSDLTGSFMDVKNKAHDYMAETERSIANLDKKEEAAASEGNTPASIEPNKSEEKQDS